MRRFVCAVLLAAAIVTADVHVGRALNIFPYFGDLSTILKVDPFNTNWFFDQDSVDIFEEVIETRSPSISDNGLFTEEFRMELCDNMDALRAAYWRTWDIEGCERSWRAFTARHFGLNSSYTKEPHGYSLVRFSRPHMQVGMTVGEAGLRLTPRTVENMGAVVPDQMTSALQFLSALGSHYVTSYTTGDSLYQVFVFLPGVYQELQKALREYKKTGRGLERVLALHSPWHVAHMGSVRTASRNASLEKWVSEQLRTRDIVFLYSSLLQLASRPDLIRTLHTLLGDSTLLSIQLASLAPLFPAPASRLWFQEVQDNLLKMWELNV